MAANSPNGSIPQIRSRDFNVNVNPILKYITESYENFYSCFSTINGNYKEAQIFDNAAFTRGPADNNKLDPDFFGLVFYAQNTDRIRELTFNNCFSGRSFKTIAEFHDSGLPVTPAIWFRLRGAILFAKNNLRKQDDTDNTTETVVQFLSKIKRGSKPFRRILTWNQEASWNPLTQRTVAYFGELANTMLPNLTSLKFCLGLWNNSCLSNDFRNFLFHLRNNSLPLNNRLNAFDQDVSPSCSFCRIIDRETAPRDSFYHFFFRCPVTKRLLRGSCAAGRN